jgi:hypothetical protein
MGLFPKKIFCSLSKPMGLFPSIYGISKMKKYFSNFSLCSLQPLIVAVKGSEKNDPNLRKDILGKSVIYFIL